jgi:hypothetical protein
MLIIIARPETITHHMLVTRVTNRRCRSTSSMSYLANGSCFDNRQLLDACMFGACIFAFCLFIVLYFRFINLVVFFLRDSQDLGLLQ